MAGSDLMKVTRAITDQHFQWRVAAAIIMQAQNIGQTGTAREKAFALAAVSNPLAPDPSMLALVAADPAVLAAITIDGEVANTDEVKDDDIKRVVVAKWSTVAWKYNVNAAQGPAQA